MGLGFGESSLRRVTKVLVIVEVGGGVEILLVARGISAVGVRVLSCQFDARLQFPVAYLDIGLDINLNLGWTSVRESKDLTLSISFVTSRSRDKEAYTSGLGVCSSLLEVDSGVESIHQTDGVKFGLDTLQEGSEKGRGRDD